MTYAQKTLVPTMPEPGGLYFPTGAAFSLEATAPLSNSGLTDSYFVELDIYMTQFAARQTIIEFGSAQPLRVQVTSTRQLRYGYRQGDGSVQNAITSALVLADTWNRLRIDFDATSGSEQIVFRNRITNAVLQTIDISANGVELPHSIITQKLHIGVRSTGVEPLVQGAVDLVRIMNDAQASIVHYQLPNLYDLAGVNPVENTILRPQSA